MIRTKINDWVALMRPQLQGQIVVVKQEPRMYVGVLDWVEVPDDLEKEGAVVRIHLQWCAIGAWSHHETKATPLTYTEWFSHLIIDPGATRPYNIDQASVLISFSHGHLAIDSDPKRAGFDREINGLPQALQEQINGS
jgi:hypothetical protein